MSGRAAHPGHVVLVGMMGTGKTTVGAELARVLGRRFLDSDAEIEARTGHTVRELFEASGEAGFRAEETAVLSDAVAGHEPSVIAAAGGVVLDPTNRRLLRQTAADGGVVAWLRADVAVLVERVSGGTHRPLLEDDPAAALARLAAAREPLYREVASVEVATDRSPADTVAALVRVVTGRSPARAPGADEVRGADEVPTRGGVP